MALKFLREFIKLESASGILLFTSAIIAIIFANSPWHDSYYSLFNAPLKFNISLNHVINDGLMTVFFLLVSLEIKRELISGELNTRAKAALPVIAAIGGMIFPALIYIVINIKKQTLNGWAIPTATDIAFSLAILTLLGSRVPAALKIFLTALAIIDDLGAIIIIAFFYTAHLQLLYLSGATGCFFLLILFNRFNIKNFWPYSCVGFILWFCILQSGIHASIAGVLLACTIPLKNNRLEQRLHPWVAYFILPIFAFANAGVSLKGLNDFSLFNPVTLGIGLGLFMGKQMGIFSICWLATKCGLAKLPNATHWRQIYGVSLLCGIGFTMSLFIGILAFPASDLMYTHMVRWGVILGSLLSGSCGYLVLRTQSSTIL